ncbi:MAG TPA: ABC transporter substrate-binding protein [Candidatus Dormibacteraeota bacterium]
MRLLPGRGIPVLLLSVVVVAACSTGGTSSGAPLPGCNSGTKQALFWTSHTPPDTDSEQNIVNNFNKQSKTTCVKMVAVPGSETDIAKLTTAVRGGTGPDIYELDRFTVAERAAAGVLTDLSSYGAADMASNYLDFAWKEALFKGKPYALPDDTDARVLYYNKDMMQAAGEDPSQLDIAKGAPTVALVRTLANKLNKKTNGKYTVVGFDPRLNQGWHYTWGFAYGGSFFDASTCKVTPDDPKIVQAFKDMFWDWAGSLGVSDLQTFESTYAPDTPPLPQAQDAFITGHLGMVVSGDWMIGLLQKYAPNLHYGITYIPVPNQGDTPATWAGGWSVVIPKGAKNGSGGWEFMKYFAGEDGQRTYTQQTTHMPTWKSLLTDTSLFPGDHALFVKQLPVAHSRPALPVGAFYWDQLTIAQSDAEHHTKDPGAALKAAADATNAKLQPFCPIAT